MSAKAEKRYEELIQENPNMDTFDILAILEDEGLLTDADKLFIGIAFVIINYKEIVSL